MSASCNAGILPARHPLPLGLIAEFLANLETNSRRVEPDANGHLPGDAVCEVDGAPEPAPNECVPGGARRFVGDARTIPPTPLDNEDGSPTPSKLAIQDTLGEQQPYLDEIRQQLNKINVPWFAPGDELTAEILERRVPDWLFDKVGLPRESTLEMNPSEVADEIKRASGSESGGEFAVATATVPDAYCDEGKNPIGPLEGSAAELASAIMDVPNRRKSDLLRRHKSGAVFVKQLTERRCQVYFPKIREFQQAKERLTTPNDT